jgi:hypothetical protein
MKKQTKKLSFTTDKVVSLTKAQLQEAQGGSSSYRPTRGPIIMA